MSYPEVLLSVVSWEERFLLSLKKSINENNVVGVVLFRSKEYLERTEQPLQDAIAFCRSKGLEPTCDIISFLNPTGSWISIFNRIKEVSSSRNSFLLDTTTMPRETIWTLLNLLDQDGKGLRCLYSQPKSYESWLSRDPAKPRIPFKLGGEPTLGMPLSLLIVTGFSPDRATQLIDFFEPENIFVAVQAGDQFSNKSRNIESNKEKFKGYSSVSYFEVDAYNRETCYSMLKDQVAIITRSSNLIMSSIGPKLSAIDLYKIHIENRNTALAYTPSNEYHPIYSKGIGDTFLDEIRTP